MVAKRVIYSGRVQGVGFRYAVKDLARGFDVCGSVENQEDGTVVVVVTGEEQEVECFLMEIKEESSIARFIKEVVVEDWECEEGVKGFKIRS